MDRAPIQTALKLLAKAESTNHEPEAIALLEKCYRMIAQIINEYDEALGAANQANTRRERRFLFDRRRSRVPETAKPGESQYSGVALAQYRRSAERDEPHGGTVDISI